MRAAVLCFALTLAAPGAASAELRLLPEPRQVVAASGRLTLRGDVTIAVPGGDPEDRFAAEQLRDEIVATGGRARVVEAREGTIVLARDGSPSALGEEGYRLEVTPGGARARASTAAGLFYAVQTLRQMIVDGGIDAATIEDRPTLRWRGLHDDLSRGPLPRIETLKRRIANAAHLKLNLYTLYLETAFEYAGHPLLSVPGGALTAAEARELSAFARARHVELVPQQQTMGHLGNVLRYERYADLAEVPHGSTLAPGERSAAFVRSLYDELAPVFPGAFFHIGADEIGEIGQGRTRARVAASSVGAVYAEHLLRLRDALAPLGRRTMFWGDALVEQPQFIGQVPKDLIVATWNYEAHDDYSKWIRPFRDAGLDVMVCPGAINWNRVFPNLDVALANVRNLVRDGRRAGAIGTIHCVWADNGDAPFDLNWYSIAASAAASWQEVDLDTARLRARFDWAMFRNPGSDAADAHLELQQAHRRIQALTRHDANLATFWQHPLLNGLDNQMVAALEPEATPVRAAAERAIEDLSRARAAARMNREALDACAFAARRMHAIGLRAAIAKQVPEHYRRLLTLAAPGSPIADARQQLNAINALLVEGRDAASSLRDEQERLWLADNRPYWLGNVLALYDRDLQVWIDKLDTFRQCDLMMRLGAKLPAPESLGLPR